MEVRGVEVGEADRGALLDGERARVRGGAVAVERGRPRERLDAPPREPVVVGEAEAALPVAHDELAVERAQLVALEVEQVPVRVRGRRACSGGGPRRRRCARCRPTSGRAAARASCRPGTARLPRTHTGPSPMLSVAEAKPSFVPAMVSRNGARWSKSGRSSRGPTSGVPESLVFSGKGSPGSSVRKAIVPLRLNAGTICSAGPLTARRGSTDRRVDRPDVEAASGERARRVREQPPVAAPGGHRDDLVAAGQALQAAAVAAHDVEARRALAGVLADEGDPAPVGRPVRLAVGPARRDRAVADVEIAVARGDDELRQSARGFGVRRPRPDRQAAAAAPAPLRSGEAELCPAMPPYAARRERTAGRFPLRTPPRPPRAWRQARRTRPRRRTACSQSSSVRPARTAASSAPSSSCAVRVEVPLRELGPADHLAEPEEELGLERSDREPAAVRGLVDPVAGEAAREEARERVAVESVRRRGGASRASSRSSDARRGPCARARARPRAAPRRRRARRRRDRRAAAAAARAPCPRARPPSRGS